MGNLEAFRRGFAGWETLKRFEREEESEKKHFLKWKPETEPFQRKLPNFLSVFIYFSILANNKHCTMELFEKAFRVFFAVIILNLFIVFRANGQSIDDPGCDPIAPLDQQPCTCPVTTNPICPIDSGVYYLLAAGLSYGIIRMRKQRKKNVPA